MGLGSDFLRFIEGKIGKFSANVFVGRKLDTENGSSFLWTYSLTYKRARGFDDLLSKGELIGRAISSDRHFRLFL